MRSIYAQSLNYIMNSFFFKEYDKENASISDEKKKMFIKILRKEENQRELDTRSQPGCDLNSYLRDLKFRAR